MPFTFLQSASSPTNTSAYSFASQNIGTAYADRDILVIACARWSGTANNTITSLTIGGVAATEIIQANDITSSGNLVGIFRLRVETGTSATIAVNLSATMVSCGIALFSVTGFDLAVPFATGKINADNTPKIVGVPEGGYLLGAACSGFNTLPNTTWDAGKVFEHNVEFETTLSGRLTGPHFAGFQTPKSDFINTVNAVTVYVSFSPSVSRKALPARLIRGPGRRIWIPPSGGSTDVAITASSSGSFSIVRQVGLIKSHAATGTNTLSREVAKINSYAGTGTAAADKSVAKSFSMSASGAFTIAALRILLQTISANGSGAFELVRSVARNLSFACAGSYLLSRIVALTFSLTGSGAMDLTATRVFLQAITASASGVASSIRSVAKEIAAAGTGSFSLTIIRSLIIAIDAVGNGAASVLRTILISLGATATGSVTLSALKVFLVTISATSSATATLLRSIGKELSFFGSGSLALIRSVSKLFNFTATGNAIIDSGQFISVIISATATGTMSLTRVVFLIISASSIASVTISLTRSLAREIAASAVGSFNYIRSIGKNITITSIITAIINTLRGNVEVHPGNIAYVYADVEAVVEEDIYECGVPNETREIIA